MRQGEAIRMGRFGSVSKRGGAAQFRAALADLERAASDSARTVQDVIEAIETTGRITYKGRTYLIVDELTGLPSHLVGK